MSHCVEGLFPVINHTFLVYKQLSTQGTIMSCSLTIIYVDIYGDLSEVRIVIEHNKY